MELVGTALQKLHSAGYANARLTKMYSSKCQIPQYQVLKNCFPSTTNHRQD